MPSGTRSKAAIAGIAGVALALVTAGCGSSKSSAPSAGAPTTNQQRSR